MKKEEKIEEISEFEVGKDELPKKIKKLSEIFKLKELSEECPEIKITMMERPIKFGGKLYSKKEFLKKQVKDELKMDSIIKDKNISDPLIMVQEFKDSTDKEFHKEIIKTLKLGDESTLFNSDFENVYIIVVDSTMGLNRVFKGMKSRKIYHKKK